MDNAYTYIADLAKEVEVPKDGILSRILYKDAQVNVTLFGFDTGQELSEHTAGSPAIIQILQGEARLVIAGEEREGRAGTWIHMPARTPHSLAAKTPVVMLLLLLKSPAGSRD
jgi:quercetin dioxygenase-like cupin family protein